MNSPPKECLQRIIPPTRPRRAPAPTSARWSWHRRTLRALRRHLLRDALEPLQGRPHTAEGGSGKRIHFALTLLGTEPDPLRELNDALDRIDFGSYGVCEETGLLIPAARLRAIPWTRHAREMRRISKERALPGG